MSVTHVSDALRERVATQARHRCGYCLSAEAILGMSLEIEHTIPESRGGLTIEENLWLAQVRSLHGYGSGHGRIGSSLRPASSGLE